MSRKCNRRVVCGCFVWFFVLAALSACKTTVREPTPVSVLSTDEEAKEEPRRMESLPGAHDVQEDRRAGNQLVPKGDAKRRTLGDTDPRRRVVAPARQIFREEVPDGVSTEPRPTESQEPQSNGASENGGYGSLRPCGEGTIATIFAENGNKLSFCNVADKAVMISEVGKLDTPLWTGTRTALPREFSCADEVFAAVAPPGVRVPPKLVEICEKRQGNRLHFSEKKIVRQALGERRRIGDETATSPPSFFSHFCSTNGRSNFRQEKCQPEWDYDSNGYRQLVWCYSNLYSWHQLTMGTQLGTNGDHGFEVLASCQGSTDHGAGYFTNVPFAGWVERVNSGYWHQWIVDNPYLIGDVNMRFTGNGVGSNARHRFAGHFVDFDWP